MLAVFLSLPHRCRQAETVDRDRADFIKQYFGVEWPDRHRFHLMINSSIGEERAVQTILNSIAILEKQTA